ncbi:hypothetical protein ACJIZ3_009593 [Penstemon smallii]|uniref:Uncharacterized protein n=1 Tax=Penstemon smallii TaxID=265156 RepID=A0ABD3TCY6_9LAMI
MHMLIIHTVSSSKPHIKFPHNLSYENIRKFFDNNLRMFSSLLLC